MLGTTHSSWQMQDKGEACLGFDKINNNAEDLLHQRPRGRCVRVQCSARQAWEYFPSWCVWRARAQSARGLPVPRGHLYFPAGLTMG